MTREHFIAEVRACQGSLRRFLTSLCGGDRSRADDISQEALVRAYVASDRFIGRFRPWLFRIAYTCFLRLSIKEIASVMQIPTGTVKYELSIGREHLRKYIRCL